MSIKQKGINLLPKEYIQEEKYSLYRKVGITVISIEVAIFILFFVLPCKIKLSNTNKTVQNRNLELASSRYEGVNKTLKDLNNARSEMDKLNIQYNLIKKEKYISSELLDELVSRVPYGVTINKFDIKDEDRQSVEDLSQKLEQEGTEAPQVNAGAQQDISRIITIDGYFEHINQFMGYVSALEIIFPSNQITYDMTSQNQGTYGFKLIINNVVKEQVVEEIQNKLVEDQKKRTELPEEGGAQ